MRHYRAEYTKSRALVIASQADEAAITLADILARPPYLFEVAPLIAERATHDAIYEALNGIYQLDEDSRFLMAYAGPAIWQHSHPALLPVDVDPEDVDSAIPLQKFLPSAMLQAKHTAYILDAPFPEQTLALNGSRLSVEPALYPTHSASVMLSAGERVDYRLLPLVIEGLHAARIDPDTWTYNFHDLIRYVYQRGTQQAGPSHYPLYGHLDGSQGADFVLMYEAGAFDHVRDPVTDVPVVAAPVRIAQAPSPVPAPTIVAAPRPTPTPAPVSQARPVGTMSVQHNPVIGIPGTHFNPATRTTKPFKLGTRARWALVIIAFSIGSCIFTGIRDAIEQQNSYRVSENSRPVAVTQTPASTPAPLEPSAILQDQVPVRGELILAYGPESHTLQSGTQYMRTSDWYNTRSSDFVASVTFDMSDKGREDWDVGFRVGRANYAFYTSSDGTWHVIKMGDQGWQVVRQYRDAFWHELTMSSPINMGLSRQRDVIAVFINDRVVTSFHLDSAEQEVSVAPMVGSPFRDDGESVSIRYEEFTVWLIQ